MGHKSGEKIGSSYCHGLGGNQVFAYTKRQQVMLVQLYLINWYIDIIKF